MGRKSKRKFEEKKLKAKANRNEKLQKRNEQISQETLQELPRNETESSNSTQEKPKKIEKDNIRNVPKFHFYPTAPRFLPLSSLDLFAMPSPEGLSPNLEEFVSPLQKEQTKDSEAAALYQKALVPRKPCDTKDDPQTAFFRETKTIYPALKLNKISGPPYTLIDMSQLKPPLSETSECLSKQERLIYEPIAEGQRQAYHVDSSESCNLIDLTDRFESVKEINSAERSEIHTGTHSRQSYCCENEVVGEFPEFVLHSLENPNPHGIQFNTFEIPYHADPVSCPRDAVDQLSKQDLSKDIDSSAKVVSETSGTEKILSNSVKEISILYDTESLSVGINKTAQRVTKFNNFVTSVMESDDKLPVSELCLNSRNALQPKESSEFTNEQKTKYPVYHTGMEISNTESCDLGFSEGQPRSSEFYNDASDLSQTNSDLPSGTSAKPQVSSTASGSPLLLLASGNLPSVPSQTSGVHLRVTPYAFCSPWPVPFQRPESPSPVPCQPPNSPSPVPFQRPSNPSPVPFQRPSSPSPVPFQRPSSPSPVPFQRPSSPSPVPFQRPESPSPVPCQPPNSPSPVPFQRPNSPSPVPFQRPSSPSPVPFQRLSSPLQPSSCPSSVPLKALDIPSFLPHYFDILSSFLPHSLFSSSPDPLQASSSPSSLPLKASDTQSLFHHPSNILSSVLLQASGSSLSAPLQASGILLSVPLQAFAIPTQTSQDCDNPSLVPSQSLDDPSLSSQATGSPLSVLLQASCNQWSAPPQTSGRSSVLSQTTATTLLSSRDSSNLPPIPSQTSGNPPLVLSQISCNPLSAPPQTSSSSPVSSRTTETTLLSSRTSSNLSSIPLQASGNSPTLLSQGSCSPSIAPSQASGNSSASSHIPDTPPYSSRAPDNPLLVSGSSSISFQASLGFSFHIPFISRIDKWIFEKFWRGRRKSFGAVLLMLVLEIGFRLYRYIVKKRHVEFPYVYMRRFLFKYFTFMEFLVSMINRSRQ